MPLNSQSKGILFAFASALTSCGVFVLGRFLLQQSSLFSFLTFWFASAAVYMAIVMKIMGLWSEVIKGFRQWRVLSLFGLGYLTSAFLFWGGLAGVDSTRAALTAQTDFMFTIMLGMLLLREIPSKLEGAGVLSVLLGAGLLIALAFQSGDSGEAHFLLWVLGSAFVESVLAVTAKKFTHRLDMRTLVFHRAWMIFLGVMAVRIIKGVPWELPQTQTLSFILVGSLLGPVATYMFYYLSLRLIPVYETGSIKCLQPLFVFCASFWFLRETPPLHTLWAAALVVGGLLLLFWGNRRRVAKGVAARERGFPRTAQSPAAASIKGKTGLH